MWSELPPDLLQQISSCETLTVPDFISFASVCHSWRSAAAATKHRQRRQSPCLMFVGKDEPNSAKLYSLSHKKVFTIPNQPSPPIANRIFIGSAYGWLITADERSELSLLNPITRQQIDLPPVSTFEHIGRCHLASDGKVHIYGRNYVSDGKFIGYGLRKDSRCIIRYTAESLRYGLYYKATLSSSPASGDFVVLLLLYQPYGVAFARPGDKYWTMIGPGPEKQRNDIDFYDDGKVYTTDWSGAIETWDFSQKDCSLIEPELVCGKRMLTTKRMYFFYLVRAPWDELLLVRRDRDDRDKLTLDDYLTTSRIIIWRVDFASSETLVKLKGLGDYALFLGGNISTCISSKDIPGLKANCVYLTDEHMERNQFHRTSRRDVGVFNLEDGSMEHILLNDRRLNWPSPIWLMPSLV